MKQITKFLFLELDFKNNLKLKRRKIILSSYPPPNEYIIPVFNKKVCFSESEDSSSNNEYPKSRTFFLHYLELTNELLQKQRVAIYVENCVRKMYEFKDIASFLKEAIDDVVRHMESGGYWFYFPFRSHKQFKNT